MSARVSNEVWQHSKADGTSLLVMLAIADQAGDDGVTYIQVESRSGKIDLVTKARCSRDSVFRALKKLVEMGELQIVQVRRGTSTINVYRVVVGRIADTSVDYDRLPFKLPHPFGAQSQIATVGTVASGGVHGRKSRAAGSDSATGHLSIDLGPRTEPLLVQEEHPKTGGKQGELAGLLRTTLRHFIPLVEVAAKDLDRVDLGKRLRDVGHSGRSHDRPLSPVERRALLGRFDELRGETARQAYERWIDETDLPLDEIAAVVATWDDLDDVDRQDLLERAETRRATSQPAQEAAA